VDNTKWRPGGLEGHVSNYKTIIFGGPTGYTKAQADGLFERKGQLATQQGGPFDARAGNYKT